MTLTLNRQMKAVLRNGLSVVREHQRSILAEWEEIATHLRRTGEGSVDDLDMVIEFFADSLFYGEEDDMEERFKNLNDLWKQRLPRVLRPSHLIFMITLLENAVHEAIQSNVGDSYRKHQAIQYLFSQISEYMLTHPFHERLDMDIFLEQLVSSQQLPIEWAAKLERTESGFKVKKLFSKAHKSVLPATQHLQANTLFSLSESLLEQMEGKQERKVFPIPYDDGTLLLCSRQKESSHILPFVTYALQVFRNGENALKITKQEQQWKDAVILFNEWIMRSRTLSEAIENVASGFVNYLPFERCALFSYSMTDHSGFGLFGHRLNNEAIQNIKEDIVNLPLIQKNLQRLQPVGENLKNLQPIYISEASRGFPEQYVRQFQLESVVVAPIFAPSGSKLLGAAIIDQGPGKKFKLSRGTFTALMKFGQSAGEILARFGWELPDQARHQTEKRLSPREVEVVQLMAEGASTNEAAEKLNLSEYTVRDYISDIMQKLNARNRTEAVVKAIRDGMI